MSFFFIRGGVLTQKKTKKKQSLHQNRQIGIGFFWFFFGFFGIGFGQNSKLETGFFWFFFGFFWFFFGFFWLKLWPTFEIGNWFLGFFGFFLVFFCFFLGFFGFFWHLILGLECHPKKTKNTKKKTKKKTKKTPKKTSRYTKIGKLAWFFFVFFWFFLVFFGVSTPPL